MLTLPELRAEFHRWMFDGLYGQRGDTGKPTVKNVQGKSYPVFTNADSHNASSVVLCALVADQIGVPTDTPISAQGSTLGSLFESATTDFVATTSELFAHLHPGRALTVNRGHVISEYAQFAHLSTVQQKVAADPELEAALGADYLVAPDILVSFSPVTDAELNVQDAGLDGTVALRSPLRAEVPGLTRPRLPLLHGSISCKWTMRRDRAQNTRLEALNLVRNRKGRLPHIAAVTMECDPEIVGSLCLGTGDIDCVYHGALHELLVAAEQAERTLGGKVWLGKRQTLERMVEGSRLRDISDLPLDLMI